MEDKNTQTNLPSVEKMSYSTFQRHYTAYRQSSIPSMLLDINDSRLELPDRSSLYTTKNFLTYMQETGDIFPDLGNPFLQHEEWRKFLHIETSIATSESRPYPVQDKMTYMPGRYRGQIQHFFSTNRDFHNTLDDASVDKARNVLACHEFAPILTATVRGTLAPYRKFEILFRTILNKIVSTQFPRYHYIQIPLSDTLYVRNDFIRTSINIGQSTLKGNEDPSYYFLIHLIGFLFNEVAKESNVKILPNDAGIMDPNDEAIAKTNSLFNRLSGEQLDTINIILTHGDRCIIYNLGDLKAFTTTLGFVDKVIRHINFLKLTTLTDHTSDALTEMSHDQFHQVVASVQGNPDEEASNDESSVAIDEGAAVTATDEPIDAKDNTTSVTAVVKPTPVKPVVITPVTEVKATEPAHARFVRSVKADLHNTVQEAAAQATTSPDAPAKRARTLIDTHMQTKIAGKTIAEHLATPDPTIEDNNLDFLADHLPDPTMAKSSIANMDQLYVKHMIHKDIAKTLTSFVRQGYFVSDVKETLQSDKFNRKINYKVKLIDVHGKQHSVNFTLPQVDEDGFMLVNGVVTRMVKQNVNLPICKVSEDRVNLASNFNKTIVERIRAKANDYGTWINKYLTALTRADLIKVDYGKLKVGNRVLPYEYSMIAQRYLGLRFDEFRFILDYDERFNDFKEDVVKKLAPMEPKWGTFCGIGPNNTFLFWDLHDVIHQIGADDGVQKFSFHFIALCNYLFGAKGVDTPAMLSEWTELKILNLTIPIVLVLGFQYGLTNTLKYINLKYVFYPKGQRVTLKPDQIRIKFADGNLVFSRYPFARSLVASGLDKWDLSKFNFAEFDAPDAYYALLESRNISSNYLRGISSFFAFFIDPITHDVLEEMHEPTNTRDLLLRATEMLSTVEHYPASSMRNHRLRGYERFASTLYNEVSRGLASYRERRNVKSGFSINPEAVFMRIMSDATVMNSEVTNPIHELKGVTQISHSGSGGRTGQSFVVNDRVFADDAVGVISEATPDSGKVAMTAYTSANPRISNLRGMLSSNSDGTVLDPSNMIGVNSMLIPGITQDD